MYNILCAGCSFTKCDWLPKGNTFGGYSYSDFLPEKAYNIGVPGAGITKHLIESFVRENKDIELTHFIYQVPSPTRQLIWSELNDEQFLKAPITVGGKDRKRFFPKKDDSKNIWTG